MKPSSLITICALSLPLLLIGCDAELGGAEENLTLTFDKGANILSSGYAPIAVGAELDYLVHEGAGAGPKVDVITASSSDESVIEVLDIEGPRITLKAGAEGSVDLDIDAGEEDDALHDRFQLSARAVDSVDLGHFCTTDERAVYLVDHDISLRYTMKGDSSILVGTGYYPVQSSPESGAQIEPSAPHGALALHTGSDAQTVQLVPNIEGDTFELDLITPQDITSQRLSDELENQENIKIAVGDTLPVHVIPYIDGDIPVCQSALAPQLRNRTPETCDISYGPLSDEERQFGDDFGELQETHGLHIEGLSEGECEFLLTLPEEVGEAGQSQRYQVQIEG